MTWDRVNNEIPSAEFRARVFSMAQAELAKLAPAPFWRRRLVLAGGLVALLAALLPWLSRQREANVDLAESPLNPKPNLDLGSELSPELLDNIELLSHLEFFADYDVLEQWDEKES